MRIRIILKRFALVAAVACSMAGLAGCYDDAELLKQLEEQERRLASLDQACAQMNTNIASLKVILRALQENDYISSTAPIVQEGKIIGYTLTFTKRGTVTVYQGRDGADGKDGQDGSNGKDGRDGQDGQDGSVPVIGAQQDADGCWYWTLNGTWLLDPQGNKLKAVGTDGRDGADGKDGQNGKDGKDGANGQDGANGKDGQDGQNGKDGQNGRDGQDGKDGVTPLLKIEHACWYVSCDGGATWTEIGQAVGEKGKDGRNGSNGRDGANGDTMFLSVDTTDPDFVSITLRGVSEVLTIPREKSLSIWLESDTVVMPPNYDAVRIKYEVTASTPIDSVAVDVVTSGGVKAFVLSNAAKPLTGDIIIASPENITENTKVLVLVSCGSSSIMRTLHLKKAYLERISQDSWQLTPAEQELELEYSSNIPGLEVVIPSSVSWCRLKCVKPKTDPLGGVDSVIVLAVDSLNLGKAERQTTVTVDSPFSGKSLTYTITQSPSAEPISFNSLSVKEKLLKTAMINTNKDEEISYYEASKVNSMTMLMLAFPPEFTGGTELFSFDEFKYFGGIEELPWGSFNDWKALTSISMPESITEVSGNIFQNCPNLTSLNGKDYWVLDNVLYKVADSLSDARKNRFEIPNGVKIIGLKAFYRSKVKHVVFPNSLQKIRDKAFEYSQIEDIVFPCDGAYETGEAYVDSISETAFNHCFKLRSFTGPTGPKKEHKIRVLSHRGVYRDTTMLAYALGSSVDTFSIPPSLDIRKLGYNLFALDEEPPIALKKLGLPYTLTHLGPYAFSRQRDMDVYFYYEPEDWPDTSAASKVKPTARPEGGTFREVDSTKNFRFFLPSTGDDVADKRRDTLFHGVLPQMIKIFFYKEWPF